MDVLFDQLSPNMVDIQFIHMMMTARGLLKPIHLHFKHIALPIKNLIDKSDAEFKTEQENVLMITILVSTNQNRKRDLQVVCLQLDNNKLNCYLSL